MDLVIVRGGGDLASGIIHKLYRSGFRVVVLEVEKPLAIRRRVSFCEAIYKGEILIEGLKGVFVDDLDKVDEILDSGFVPVLIDESGKLIEKLKPLAVVDAILAKKNLGTNRSMADITIGVGPGFEAGVDVDIVIESKRGHDLGRLIEEGFAIEDTGIPGEIMGSGAKRVLRAGNSGKVKAFFDIGDLVKKGDLICRIDDENIYAEIDGVLRGIIKDGLLVDRGRKIGDIDPRNNKDYAFTISDKARSIAGGVLEAILYLKIERSLLDD